MNNKKIDDLLGQIESEKRKIHDCKHIFNDPFYNPEIVREPIGYKMIGHGSDVYYEPDGYIDVTKDRWTRECKLCGCVSHTNKQVPVISGYTPSFN